MVSRVAPSFVSHALPAFREMHAPAQWQNIDFVSDLHLATNTPKTLKVFADYLEHCDADAIFILGDLFEIWVGDDARHQAFEASCAHVLGEAAARRTIAFMAGNRDFLIGADFLKACGVMALADPTVLLAYGQRVLLSHGDALCLNDVAYQQFRSVVRSAHWQDDFLSRPLSVRQRLAREMRTESQSKTPPLKTPEVVDIDTASAVRWMHECATPVLVHGHTHQPTSESMAPGFSREVLSDWDFDHSGVPRAQVLRWGKNGFTRMAPHLAVRRPPN